MSIFSKSVRLSFLTSSIPLSVFLYNLILSGAIFPAIYSIQPFTAGIFNACSFVILFFDISFIRIVSASSCENPIARLKKEPAFDKVDLILFEVPVFLRLLPYFVENKREQLQLLSFP